MIYLAKIKSTNYYKIGFSKNVNKRIASLNTATPLPVILIESIDGGYDLENLFHSYYRKYKIKNEWFDFEYVKEKEILAVSKDELIKDIFKSVKKFSDVININKSLKLNEKELIKYYPSYNIDYEKYKNTFSKKILRGDTEDLSGFWDKIKMNVDDINIKEIFLNALINRLESKHTQEDVARALNISKRTVIALESGKVNNIVTIFNYIHHYGKDNAQIRLRRSRAKYYKNR